MIYLDAAATTFQKPRTVAAAVERAMHYMTTPGRGAYQEARLAAEAAFRCRSEAAALFHVPSEDNVVFTFNATHALNIAVKTLVRPATASLYLVMSTMLSCALCMLSVTCRLKRPPACCLTRSLL